MNKTNIKDLESEARRILEIAKAALQKDGMLAPKVCYYKADHPTIVHNLRLNTMGEKTLERKRVKAAILTAKPDMVLVISDIWVKSVAKSSPEEVEKSMQEGIAEAPDRTEAIMVSGGCLDGQLMILQPYTRQGDTIVFGEMMIEFGHIENEFFGNSWEQLAQQEGKGQVFH